MAKKTAKRGDQPCSEQVRDGTEPGACIIESMWRHVASVACIYTLGNAAGDTPAPLSYPWGSRTQRVTLCLFLFHSVQRPGSRRSFPSVPTPEERTRPKARERERER